jgi:hypothetical protein
LRPFSASRVSNGDMKNKSLNKKENARKKNKVGKLAATQQKGCCDCESCPPGCCGGCCR